MPAFYLLTMIGHASLLLQGQLANILKFGFTFTKKNLFGLFY